MENQHREIKGYRELSEDEIAAMNEVKATAEQVGELIEGLQGRYPITLDHRWSSIAKTHLQQGFMALTRAIAKPTFFVLSLVLLSGCISPYKQPDGSFLITKHTEVRSPFGTNGGYDFLEKCQGPEGSVLFYMESDFSNCQQVKLEEYQQITANHKASQGQGGQILEGAMNAGALGALAATKAGGNAAASAGAVAIQTVTVTSGKGHRR